LRWKVFWFCFVFFFFFFKKITFWDVNKKMLRVVRELETVPVALIHVSPRDDVSGKESARLHTDGGWLFGRTAELYIAIRFTSHLEIQYWEHLVNDWCHHQSAMEANATKTSATGSSGPFAEDICPSLRRTGTRNTLMSTRWTRIRCVTNSYRFGMHGDDAIVPIECNSIFSSTRRRE
jgi:hypothetical protein